MSDWDEARDHDDAEGEFIDKIREEAYRDFESNDLLNIRLNQLKKEHGNSALACLYFLAESIFAIKEDVPADKILDHVQKIVGRIRES